MRFYWDTETTGLHAGRDELVEVACVAVDDAGVEVAVFESLIRVPDEFRESRGLQINGIEWSALQKAPERDAVVVALRKWLDSLGGFRGGEATWHSYNVAFDSKFLEREPWLIYGLWSDCVMQAAHRMMATRKWPKLAEAAIQFGVEQSSAHRALVDARTAWQVHEAILRARKALIV